jgi:hypothetical protein
MKMVFFLPLGIKMGDQKTRSALISLVNSENKNKEAGCFIHLPI